jgi:aldehyde dehydrogenase (NAD+)
LPKGVVNIINGDAQSGDYLVAHPGIAKISFTGGSATAAKILSAIAPRTAPALLELGGKSASIVFDDADLESAAAAVIGASVALQSGQACIAGTRILVQRKVYAPMIELLKRNAAGVPIGDPMLFLPPNLPFGGFGASGYGREGGLQGILEMAQSKAVQIKVGRP